MSILWTVAVVVSLLAMGGGAYLWFSSWPGQSPDGAWSTVLDTLSDALWIVGRDERIRYANEVAREQFPLADGATVWDLLDGAEAETFRATVWKRSLAGARHHGLEMTLRGRHGRRVPARVSLAPDQASHHIVVMAHDIGDLRDLAHELRPPVQRHSRTGRWMDQVGDELVASVRALVMQVEPLRRDPALAEEMGPVVDISQTVLRLVSDAVLLARAEAATLHLEGAELDLGRSMGDWAGELDRISVRSGVGIDIEGPPAPVWFDPSYLRRAVVDPIRYAAYGLGTTQVRVSTRREAASTWVEIVAEGSQVTSSQLELALRGRSPDGPTARRLSLAVARRLLQRGGGDFVARVREGGLSLVLRFPATDPGAIGPVPSESETLYD